MAEKLGGGNKITFEANLTISQNNALPDDFCIFNKVDLPNLLFNLPANVLVDFVENSGIFTFNLRGHLQILATLNFLSTGVSGVEIAPVFKRGAGAWTYLNARRAGLPIIGQNHAFMTGSVDIEVGDKMRFEIKANNLNASFATEVLSNTAIIPAGVIDFLLLIR